MHGLLELVDGAAGGRVLVFGAPPPDGRDLDLLARPAEEERLRTALSEAGFRSAGPAHVRFRDCDADVVELVPAAQWRLAEPELEALFADAAPLEGSERLVLPAPHHALLIAARKIAWGGGVLDERRRSRVESALAANGSVLMEARRQAAAWDATAALEVLERALSDGGRAPRPAVARAVAELAAVGGSRAPWLSGLRAALPSRPRRGALFTFSGLDGSGKSSQAAALRDTLDRLGYDAVVEWSSLSQHPPFLHLVTRAAERILRRRPLAAPPSDPPAAAALRERSAAVTFIWSTLVAVTNALEQSRAVNRHLWRGRVVICDRYTLDSRVHLRYAYGERRRFTFQAVLIKLLSPTPDRAYLLDVSPETATSRKQDYPLLENARRARLYREERTHLGVIALNGELPREEICERVAEDVRAALGT